MYPEVAINAGMLRETSIFSRLLLMVSGWSYKSYDVVVDIGNCVRERILKVQRDVKFETVLPWSLGVNEMPSSSDLRSIRSELFGDAKIGILYSGSFGEAHECEQTIRLARELRDHSVQFCFAVSGNKVNELKSFVNAEDTNIKFCGPADMLEYENRLAAADIHLVTLKSAFTGLVVPSKFFGSIALGKPVLFEGDFRSSLANYILDYQLGWVLTPDSFEDVRKQILDISNDEAKVPSSDDIIRIHNTKFSRSVMTKKFAEILEKV